MLGGSERRSGDDARECELTQRIYAVAEGHGTWVEVLEEARGLFDADEVTLTAWATVSVGAPVQSRKQSMCAEVVWGGGRGRVACVRGGRAFDEVARARLARLAAHFGRAAQLSETARRCASLEELLDSLSLPALLVTPDAEVLWAAEAARPVLASTEALALSGGRLVAASTTLSAELTAALNPVDEALPKTVRVPRDGAPLWLLCWPVAGATPRVLVALHDAARVVGVDPRLLQAVYGLTETEAALCAALVGGRTVLQFALDRGTSEATARVHLKRVLKKTGAGGQVDLIRGLLGGAFPRQVDLQ